MLRLFDRRILTCVHSFIPLKNSFPTRSLSLLFVLISPRQGSASLDFHDRRRNFSTWMEGTRVNGDRSKTIGPETEVITRPTVLAADVSYLLRCSTRRASLRRGDSRRKLFEACANQITNSFETLVRCLSSRRLVGSITHEDQDIVPCKRRVACSIRGI